MILWTPAHLSTAPAQWLDMGDDTTYTIDTGVSQRLDKSGNDRHATQTVDASQPTLSAASLNGLDVDQYDGTDDFMDISVPQSLPCHIFLLVRTGSLQTGDRVILNRSITSAPYPPALYLGGNSGNYTPAIFWGSAWTKSYSSGLQTDYLVEYRLSASDVGIRVNGGTEQTASHSNSALSTWTSINAGVQSSLCGVASLLVINYDLTTDERQLLEGSLLWEFGLEASLGVSHPYYSSPPMITDFLDGNIVAPLPTITGDATNAVVSAGNIVAPKTSIGGKVWNTGLGDVVAPISVIAGTSTNQVPAIGRVTLRGKVSGVAYNPVVSVAGVTAKLPIISGRAVNQELVYGGVTARGRIFGRATNLKAFEPIKFRRCGS